MNEIFVFGSNLQGRHGKGAALYAKEIHGAKNGQGEGLQGDSYAIPTKETPWVSLPIDDVREHVRTFLKFAASRPDLTFRVTAIGCGYAGFKPHQIAPMFADAPSNCILPVEFRGELGL